jgi:hypothetical protein
MIGWIITAATALGFAGVIVFVVWGWKRIIWPKNAKRNTVAYRDFTAHVFVSHSVAFEHPTPEGLGRECARALQCTYDAWMERKKLERPKYTEAIIHFMSNAEFDASFWMAQNWAAYSMHAKAYFAGSDMPQIRIRAEYMEQVMRNGEPVIHEMLHFFHGIHLGHAAVGVWFGGAPHKGSIQALAQRKFRG